MDNSPDSSPRPTILLVDDVPTNLEVMAGALEKDYDLIFALSGPEALELIGNNPPDLVLLDVMMPDMSGHEVHQRIRANPATQNLPVIFVSADTSEISELEGLNQGADDYLVKPVVGPILHARVRNLLTRRRLEHNLRSSEAIFSTLTNVAPVAILLLDAELGCRYTNTLWTQLTGLEAPNSLGQEWNSMVHPEDQATVMAALAHSLGSGSTFQMEFRLLSLTRLTWVYGQAAPIKQQAGNEAVRMILTLTDITRHKATELALTEQEKQLEVLIDAMDDLVITFDTASCIRTFHTSENQPSFGDPAAFIGHEYNRVLPPTLSAILDETLPMLILSPAAISREFALDTDEQGSTRYFHAIFSALQNGSGWPTGFLCVARDITQRKEMEQELARLATTDVLTGVANRRRFIDETMAELQRLQRFNKPNTLLMVDIDHFKRVNDTYGHAIGDAVLCHLAGLAVDRLRSCDLFGRIGGEEFAILLPGTDLEGAAVFAEQFREYVYAHPAQTESGPVSISLSIGLTAFHPEDGSSDTIFARADEALYRAKEAGRNRVEIQP